MRKWLQSLRTRREAPLVLVYHMGKVGSTSIFESLVAAGVQNIHHLNRLSPENIETVRRDYQARGQPVPPGDEEGLRVYADITAHPRRIKCISSVRDPIRRNLSAFFFTSARFNDAAGVLLDVNVAELRELFLREYAHDVPLTWFDLEMKPVLGVDVYEHAFPREAGHLTIRKGSCEVLLLKCEMPDERKAELVREFVGLPRFALKNENRADDKRYAAVYKEFLSGLVLPKEYLDRMCEARFTKHFYTEAEIADMRQRWSGKATSSGVRS